MMKDKSMQQLDVSDVFFSEFHYFFLKASEDINDFPQDDLHL